MSWSEHCVRNHKRQTDYAIHRAYARLASDTSSTVKFQELLHYVRSRAPRLLEPHGLDGFHAGVEALVNLSRFHARNIRLAADWPGTTACWRVAVASLAHHLIGKYEIPFFLAAAWYSTNEEDGDTMCHWFVSHASGASFRSLNLPIAMTRRMEDIFLASPDHLAIAVAMRRAELLALGMPAEFVEAVLSTRLARDLSNGAFWRTFWIFLIANTSSIDPTKIGPMIDFIQAIRHERQTVETQNGTVTLDPPQPTFSMKGRTPQSMLCLVEDWHKNLGLANASFTWEPSPFKPMLIEEPSQDLFVPPGVWQLIELTNSAQLRAEGLALRHCVVSYTGLCRHGTSRIWSLRLRRGEKIRHVMTIEVDIKRRAVVQARGWANRAVRGKPLGSFKSGLLENGCKWLYKIMNPVPQIGSC